MESIVDKIGVPATLEQLAEECAELSQAALKMARKLRGENPTPKKMTDIIDALAEEVADVSLCLNELDRYGIIDSGRISVQNIMEYKLDRWKKRIDEGKDAVNENREVKINDN